MNLLATSGRESGRRLVGDATRADRELVLLLRDLRRAQAILSVVLVLTGGGCWYGWTFWVTVEFD